MIKTVLLKDQDAQALAQHLIWQGFTFLCKPQDDLVLFKIRKKTILPERSDCDVMDTFDDSWADF